MKKLFLIDAYALIFKYYYAFFRRPMRNRAGLNTSIVYGFTKFLKDIQKRESPDLLGVAFDHKAGSFRRGLYPDYKGNRPPTPEDIIQTTPYVKRLLEAMNIPIYEIPDYEADDTIGTLAKKGEEAGYDVYMVTPDKDYGQLVSEHRRIYKQKGDDIEIIGREQIREKYGIEEPILVRDILALWGDSADNIPGVPHVGEKTACGLVKEWGDVENIIEHAKEIKGTIGCAIADNSESLRLAKTLTTICVDVPVEFNENALAVCAPDREKLKALYEELEFRSFLKELDTVPVRTVSSEIKEKPTPVSLFDTVPTSTALKDKPSCHNDSQPSLFDLLPEEKATDIGTKPDNTYKPLGDKDFQAAVKELAASGSIFIDIETSGLNPFADRVVGLSIASEKSSVRYLSLSNITEKQKDERIKGIAEILSDKSKEIIGHNLKFVILFLKPLGIKIEGCLYDTMLMHYILDPEGKHALPSLVSRYLGRTIREVEDIIGRGSNQIRLDEVAETTVGEYASEKTEALRVLFGILKEELSNNGFCSLYNEIEAPLIPVLADMEYEGVTIDTAALHEYSAVLQNRLQLLETKIRNEADEETLNINSSKQLGEVLFGKMHIASKPKMTKTHQYCTDEEYLQGFAQENEIIRDILEYRGVKKLLSTYVDALPLLVSPQTGRIHTSYNQAVTSTGRLSSTNPNLQNIPIREEMGKPIRAAFIPSEPDRLLLSADYSQVELRIMAHLSGDDGLISAFQAGEDVHSATAARIFNKKISEVTAEERRKAKTANFGIIYGISAFGLAQRLGISRTEAKQIIEGYFVSYPKVGEYMKNAVQKASENGYVETLFGRRRYLPDIMSSNSVVRGFAERNAINAPIQGTAADIMKKAMAAIHRRFAAEGVKSKIILQVHDEVVIDLLVNEKECVEKIVKEEMENAANLSVRLEAECGIGKNWLEAH